MNYAARMLCAMRAFSSVLLLSSLLFAQPLSLEAQSAAGPSALSPFARAKAEQLLQDKRGCLGCHAMGGKGGKLAPALDDVRARRSPAYIAAIISDPQRVVPGAAMPRERMRESERTLLIRYLGGDPSASFTPTMAAATNTDTSAAALYVRWCAGCHGAAGKGDGPNAANLPVAPAKHSDAAMTSLRSDDALFDTIHGGGAIMNRSARMPAFGGTLSAAEITRLVRYIRTLCKCEGPAWSRSVGGA